MDPVPRQAEHRLARTLLSLVRGEWNEAREPLSALAGAPRPFIDLCRACDVHPWVHHLLQQEFPELAGSELLLGLESLRRKVRHDNMLLLGRAEQALDLLSRCGVVPIALKGLDLIHRMYDSFDQRTLDDVDLLLRFADLPAALRALEEAGWQPPPEPRRTHYIRSSHHLPLVSPGPVTVDFELHWNLVQEGRYSVEPGSLFARAQQLEVAGRRILRLEDHDQVAHLLVHHFSHYFDRRLKWLVDLRALVRRPGFEWDRVVERIHQWGGTISGGAALRHLNKLDPATIPEAALRRLPIGGWRRAATRAFLSTHPLELYRHTGERWMQLYLAAIMLERPGRLPHWLIHRVVRVRRSSENPLDSSGNADAGLTAERDHR